MYADNTELSKSVPPDRFVSFQSCIQTYIDDVLLWMNSNEFKLNTHETEVMPVDTASRLESVDSECANIGGNSVPFKTSFNTLESSILIEHCQRGSTSAALNQSPSVSILHKKECLFVFPPQLGNLCMYEKECIQRDDWYCGRVP